mmetsp:Transcript_16518/g.57847  ORF Transcript_16518/g.57847 Transcript_16518/m.57847 type:complete len:184 (+) Transcript_16518:1610-2161(+)
MAFGHGAAQSNIEYGSSTTCSTIRDEKHWIAVGLVQTPMSCQQSALTELQIFPEFVQIFSLRQHLTWSNKRIGSIGLDYRVFVECICRIGFLYLTFYGNATQQPAPSKWKCLWVLTMLRVRCRDLGRELGLPDGLVGDNHFDGGLLWRQQSSTRQLDVMPLEDLVFWHAFDHGEAPQLSQSPD